MRNRINFLNFKIAFSAYLIISTNDIYKLFPDFDKRRLFEWCQKGFLKRVAKGFYIFAENAISEELQFFIANKIYEPSYVSLQSALSYYNLIPEYTPKVTSISSKKTTTFQSPFSIYSYYSIKPKAFAGYKLKSIGDHNFFKIARAEKAIIDFLYLNKTINTREQIDELRINSEVFSQIINRQKIYDLVNLYTSKTLDKKITILLKTIDA